MLPIRQTSLILWLSLAANLIALTIAGIYIERQGGFDYVQQKLGLTAVGRHVDTPLYQGRVDTLANMPPPNGRWVFLGDSMTDYAPLDELFVEPTANRGLASDHIADIKARLAPLLGSRPAGIVVWAGINDLLSGRNCAQVANDLIQLFHTLQGHFLASRVVLIEIAPIAFQEKTRMNTVNDAIQCTNERLNVELPEASLVTLEALRENGWLQPAQTLDGLHLNAFGYRTWAKALALKIGLSLR